MNVEREVYNLRGRHLSEVLDELETLDFGCYWPVVNSAGVLTGDITDCQDEQEWRIVDWVGDRDSGTLTDSHASQAAMLVD